MDEHDCGCRTATRGDDFIIYPCAPDCATLQMLVTLTDEDGKDLEFETIGSGEDEDDKN